MIASGLGSPTAACLPHSHVQIPSFTTHCISIPSPVPLRSLEAAKCKSLNAQRFGSLTFPSEDKRKQWMVKAAEEESGEAAPPAPEPPQLKKKEAKVVVKSPRKQRLVLKFMWLEKNIGLALDQVIPGHGTIPLSPYYFWPRKDAWEELKAKLESKSWISQKRTIILLNQATDIINLWQQSGSNL